MKILENKQLIATILIISLLAFIIYAGWNFISALFGALILFVTLRPLNNYLIKKQKINKKISVWITLFISIVIIIIPLVFLVQGIIGQTQAISQQFNKLENVLEAVNQYIDVFGIDISRQQVLQRILPVITENLGALFSNITHSFMVIFLIYFLLYYMILNEKEFIDKTKSLIPFNKENTQKILKRFEEITYGVIVGNIIIALIQGGLLAIAFYILGIQGALFWGFITAILAFIPLIGSPLIFVPVMIYQLTQGDITGLIILTIFGVAIMISDNILRPILNRKFGQVHPVISIIGIIIGVAQFGIIGIFIGPLIVAYLVLFWQIYKEEYM